MQISRYTAAKTRSRNGNHKQETKRLDVLLLRF